MAETRFLNGCVWTPTAAGSGTWTVSAAVSPYFTPAGCTNPAAVNAGTYNYFAVSGAEYEIGQGVYTVSGTTLTRATIKSSSNAGAVVNFSSAPTVYMGGPLSYDVGCLSGHPIKNHLISYSVGGNALTIAAKQRDGTDASSSTPIVVPFRSATAGTDGLTEVNIVSALSTVIPSTATAGHTNNLASALYVYFINNSGTAEIAWSSTNFGEHGIISTTTVSTSADSATVMYSTTGRSNVAFRLAGMCTSLQTTAGTWATAPQNAQPVPLPTAIKGIQAFTGNGTFTQRAGCFHVRVRLWGGGGGGNSVVTGYGGGGGGYSERVLSGLPPGAAITVTVGAVAAADADGNTSSFGSYCSATGGATLGTGGIGSGGDLNLAGGDANFGISGAAVGSGGGAPFMPGVAGGGGSLSGPPNSGSGGGSAGGAGSAGLVIVEYW